MFQQGMQGKCPKTSVSLTSTRSVKFCMTTVQVRGTGPTHTQNARTFFALTRFEKRVSKRVSSARFCYCYSTQ